MIDAGNDVSLRIYWVVAERGRDGYTPEERGAHDRKYYSNPFNRRRKRQRQREYYYRNRETCLDRIRKINYKLSGDDYQQMLAAQGSCCAICRGTSTVLRSGRRRQLAVDHDHLSGGVRGLLCNDCNAGLGYFRNDPAFLIAAAAYLKRSRTGSAIAPFRPPSIKSRRKGQLPLLPIDLGS
jgi:hypothetical protein